MTEYVATRWYRAPEVMLCKLTDAGIRGIADRQHSRSIQKLLISGVSDVSLLKCVSFLEKVVDKAD
jgi:hypothetical protein